MEFYEETILLQAIKAIVPRVLWETKPDTENLVMERVYDCGIVDRNIRTPSGGKVSAKPTFIADAYLSFGLLGILIACYIYGALVSILSRLAERWFGGYEIGTALIFNALFMIMWRGACFEYLMNTVFWSFIIMAAISFIGRSLRFIVPESE
jgi:hypothetical protein